MAGELPKITEPADGGVWTKSGGWGVEGLCYFFFNSVYIKLSSLTTVSFLPLFQQPPKAGYLNPSKVIC